MSGTGALPPVVHIVDGDELASQALRFLFSSAGVASLAFPDLRSLLDRHDPAQPGCLLLDAGAAGMSALEFLDRHVEFGFTLPVVVLTATGNVSVAVNAMKAGAIDFLTKPAQPQQVLGAVRQALRVDEARRRERATREDLGRRLAALSSRERDVAERVALGLISRQIAAELGISARTVETHLAGALRKLGLRNTPELVRLLAQYDATRPAARSA